MTQKSTPSRSTPVFLPPTTLNSKIMNSKFHDIYVDSFFCTSGGYKNSCLHFKFDTPARPTCKGLRSSPVSYEPIRIALLLSSSALDSLEDSEDKV